MQNNLLEKNLDNVQFEVDLFGNKIEKLSMMDRIGFAPISIWQPDWKKTKELKSIIGDRAEARDGITKTSYNTALGNRENNISIFNPHLAQMILSAYCPAGAKIYDPFAGGGTRACIAASMGHKYYGIELRDEEVERIISKRKELGKEFHIQTGDSQQYPFEPGEFDFSYTCPPYYNLEVYSEMQDDLSNAPDYSTFLEMIARCLLGVYASLKPGCLSVWVVGNFRDKKGSLVHFNGDVIRIGQDTGFKLHDELIFWGASGNAVQRSGQFEANRKSVRVHEYIIIFKK